MSDIDLSELDYDSLVKRAKELGAELHMAESRINELEGALGGLKADLEQQKNLTEIHRRRRCEKDETILAVINALRAGGEVDDE